MVALEGLAVGGKPALRSDDPSRDFYRVAHLLVPEPEPVPGVHPSAVVDTSAAVDASASVGPHCVVGPGVRVGARSVLHAGVVLQDAAGRRYSARFCVCTAPLGALRDIAFSPSLPELHAQAVATIPPGDNTSIYFHVKEPFWDIDALPGATWSTTTMGRAMKYRGADEYYLWMNKSGAANVEFRALGEAEIRERAMAELVAARPSAEGRVEITAVMSWHQLPFQKGHIPYRAPGNIAQFGNVLAEPHGRIQFAGDYTAVLNLGLEGAMESGERAALEILSQA